MTTTGGTSTGRGRSAMVVPTAISIERRERKISVSQPEISRGDVLSFYAYSARLLLFACSCAASDSTSLTSRDSCESPMIIRAQLYCACLKRPISCSCALPTQHLSRGSQVGLPSVGLGDLTDELGPVHPWRRKLRLPPVAHCP